MNRGSLVVLALLQLAGCGRQEKSAEPKEDDFALSLKVEADGAKVQRLDLPAAALVTIRRPDKGDLRVVDAQGRSLSMAFIEPDAVIESKVQLSAIPFDSSKGKSINTPVSVHVEQDGSSVRVESGGGEEADEIGVLFDTRSVKESAVGISLEAELPKQKPVTISIAAGDDLKSWEPLAEQILFRPGNGHGLLGGSRIELPSADLRGRYLRVSAQGEPRLAISGATLFTSSIPCTQPVIVSAKGLGLTDAHSLAFTLPNGIMPAALRVTMTGNDGVIPLRLLGRDNAEAPWTPLAIASLQQGSAGVLMTTGEQTLHMLKLEADPRSAGFSTVPKVELQYAPITLAVAFNGAGPYRLLVGNSKAKPAVFALQEITNAPDRLAQAKVVGARTDVAVELTQTGQDTKLSPRVIALWAALLVGVALLAYAAIRLMRANNAA